MPDDRAELFIGLVGPAGVPLRRISTLLTEHLKTFGYNTEIIHLSDLLGNQTPDAHNSERDEYERILNRQREALAFRKIHQDGAALVRAGVQEIRKRRSRISGDPNVPASNYAFVLDQLKHPAEVELLRQIYGTSFVLVAGHAPKSLRVETLARRIADSEDKSAESSHNQKAEHIIDIDENEKDEDGLGQNTRDTYPLADFFVNLGREGGENEVRRFIDLLFGHPFHTPDPAEYAMYQAAAGSLRSSDYNRQVGAVIVKMYTRPEDPKTIANVDVVASGMNEVPRRGGGLYWREDSPDNRDQWLIAYRDDDRAKKIKTSALAELLEKIAAQGWLNESTKETQPNILARELLPKLKGTQFMNIGEFSRPVHAEMAALIDGARRGVAVHGLSMYVTTFPCHNCAKHIIAAGIRKVIYMEPYPKSRADNLHGEEIWLESVDGESPDDRIPFVAFTGVAPRQYGRIFNMGERGAKHGLPMRKWDETRAQLAPLYISTNAAGAYVRSERDALDDFSA